MEDAKKLYKDCLKSKSMEECMNYITKKNWERVKNQFKFVQYCCKLYNNKELLKHVDKDELLRNLKILWKTRFPLISTDPSDWWPVEIRNCISWSKGQGLGWSIIDSLGMDLIRNNKRELLEILAKAGDKKARTRLERMKLPSELKGKKLDWLKINDKEWMVTITGKLKKISEYDRDYEKWVKYVSIIWLKLLLLAKQNRTKLRAKLKV